MGLMVCGGRIIFDLSLSCIFEMRPGHVDFLVSCVPLWTQQAGLSHNICVWRTLTDPAVKISNRKNCLS